MSTTAPKATAAGKVKRVWIPAGALALVSVGLIAIWAFAGDQLDLGQKRFATIALGLLGLALLTLWIVLLSGLSWLARIAWIMLLVLVGGSLNVDFDGDMKPTVSIWWLDQRLSKLEAHRASQKKVEGELKLAGVGPLDVPAFRGIHRDGIIPGPDLAGDWKTQPPKQLWKQPIGGGYAGFVGVGGVLFTIEQRGKFEVVACYDATTGSERWKYEHAAHFQEALGGPGPRATPTFFDGKLYSLGATGHLACLDAATGKPLWTKEILEGNANIQWGMSGSPLVFDDLVVVNPGAQNEASKGKALMAFDRNTGAVRWTSGDTRAGYSSPQLFTIAGERQVLMFDGEGLGGYDPKDGKRLWWFAYPTYQGINVAQPIQIDSERILISAGYGVGSALVRIAKNGDQWEAKREPWKEESLMSKFASPVLHEGFIYGLDDGILACFDAKTGERKWKGGRYGHGQVLLRGNTLFIQCETGDMVLVKANPAKHEELAKQKVFDDNKTWNTPLLHGGQAFVRSASEMAGFILPEAGPAAKKEAAPTASQPEAK